MLAIIIPVNIYLFGTLIMLALLTGLFIRRIQIKKLKKKVFDLENEMLSNHADILDLQKEKANLEQKLKVLHIPVIPISAKDDTTNSKLQDISKRKIAQQTGSGTQH